jgi:hypothetical protein
VLRLHDYLVRYHACDDGQRVVSVVDLDQDQQKDIWVLPINMYNIIYAFKMTIVSFSLGFELQVYLFFYASLAGRCCLFVCLFVHQNHHHNNNNRMVLEDIGVLALLVYSRYHHKKNKKIGQFVVRFFVVSVCACFHEL